jgi:hypothetical protein
MQIHISDATSTEEIKKQVSANFPFLKIEFFTKSHGVGEGSPASEMIKDDHLIGDIRKSDTEGDLVLDPNMKVKDVEESFKEKFGVNAQVFRKSGAIWLETTATDEWTLKEQNDTGVEMKS